MKKKLFTAAVLVLTLLILASCGNKEGSKNETDYGPGSNVITSAKVGGEYCTFDAYKNPGGQETGIVCKIYIPKDKVTDKKNVSMEITLADDWKVSEDSNCLKQTDGNKLTVDLSINEPQLIVRTENGNSRCYHLIAE